MSGQVDRLACSQEAARKRRDGGIRRAVEHADAVVPDWQRKAQDRLREFIEQRQGAPFLAEEFVSWVRFKLEAPPDSRAWGGVIQRAATAGTIIKVGYAKARTSNLSPKCQWRGAGAVQCE